MESIADIVEVVRVRGAQSHEGHATLLIEVPHGATERAHYDTWAAQLDSMLPADLHLFFGMNTDIGSWEMARTAAQAWVQADPTASVLLLRCLIPRTFIDVNRRLDVSDTGVLTKALPPYVDVKVDHERLQDAYRQYTAVAEAAYAEVCGNGGRALIPHTYGPVTLGIASVGRDIIEQLRRVHEPDQLERWPVRSEADLITETPGGVQLAPDGWSRKLAEAWNEAGIAATFNDTYILHPASMGYVWSERYPGQVLCFEIRRDLLVDRWQWDAHMVVDPNKVDRIVKPLVAALAG